jgi:predicted  nucleic acid-binding Zn-ribbon protein
MSGRVRNHKELEGMEANVTALKRRRSGLEDEDLEAMLEIERCQAQADAARATLAEEEARWQASQAKLTDELNRSVAELKTLAARLNHQWEAVPATDREFYRSLRQRKGGRALALERNGECTACGVALPTGMVQAVHGNDQRILCPSCGRLLHAQR